MTTSHRKGKILCLDYGTKRLGIAVSDEEQIIAFPLPYETMVDLESLLVFLSKKIKELSPKKIVVGNPLNLNFSKGTLYKQIEKFSKILNFFFLIPVILWDERLSSLEAEKILRSTQMKRKKRKSYVDSLAAQLILTSFLNSLKTLNDLR